jgi:16S rRNA (uracil1498-N3)-methyltransferase
MVLGSGPKPIKPISGTNKMPRYDFITRRLFVEQDLQSGTSVLLDRKQSNYLLNVLRHKHEDHILLFNGRDGEWLSKLEVTGRKSVSLTPFEQTRTQPKDSNLIYCFAPLKKGRLDYMVQKAVEMGAGKLQPVITEFTQNASISRDKINANIVDAAQQCGIISLPRCCEPVKFNDLLANWNNETRLIFCDEGSLSQNPLEALGTLKIEHTAREEPRSLAVLIGPEGGFSESERRALHAKEFVTAIPLGPRVLRADTAAVAALAIIQATIGDWY